MAKRVSKTPVWKPSGKLNQKFVSGWVIGTIYPTDDGEWLFHKKQLCSHNQDRKESRPTVYETQEKARKVAEQMLKEGGHTFKNDVMYIREYIWETPSDQPKLELLGDRNPKAIFLRGGPSGLFGFEVLTGETNDKA